MATLLYLVHRMPYPPNKGDKVRSYHLLQHLAREHKVFVGTFIDDPDDERHIPALAKMCAGLHVAPLHPLRARVASLAGLATGEPLTLRYYRNAALSRWVAETVAREKPAASIVFSSSMAPYATAHPALPMLVSFVDVDSAKWTDYAPQHRWPLSAVYAREGRTLLAYERAVAAEGPPLVLRDRQGSRAVPPPGAGEHPHGRGDGQRCRRQFLRSRRGARVAVPSRRNAIGVHWRHGLLAQRRRRHLVRPGGAAGLAPEAAEPALPHRRPRAHAGREGAGVGRRQRHRHRARVRPYLQHAAVVVAPLRLARGIQNKILEAMAMERPVVAATACVEALDVHEGADIVPAAEAADYVRTIEQLLASPDRASAIGVAGRLRVQQSYSWAAHLQRLDRALARVGAAPSPAAAGVPA